MLELLAGLAGLAGGACVGRICGREARGRFAGQPRACLVASALVGAVCAAVLTHVCGASAQTVELYLLALALLQLSLSDLDRSVIPNQALAFAAVVRLVFLAGEVLRGSVTVAAATAYVIAAVGVAVCLVVSILVAERLCGAGSMGGGDLKLYALAALYVGWLGALVVIALSCLLGLASSLVLAVGQIERPWSQRVFPLGPSIALSVLVVAVVQAAVASQGLLF